ncbi:exopolysaccharide biosynthesis protein [Corallincola platygyrae]|uniref:Exopolysaccharide biosynthesis protein n=1 Tax=Corallincola platygyrae TaxID=1193278 RepID=A0ABW4XRC2_9GAMM
MAEQQVNQTVKQSLPVSSQLQQLLSSCSQTGISFGELLKQTDKQGMGMLLMLLALPSALPIPAPGYSIPFGICLLAISFQMLICRENLSVPKRIANVKLSASMCQKVLRTGTGFFRLIERVVKPRGVFIHSSTAQRLLAINVMLMASLMLIPIPMTNTLPALVIFTLGTGLAAKDGLTTSIALLGSAVAILFYSGVAVLGTEFISSMLQA